MTTAAWLQRVQRNVLTLNFKPSRSVTRQVSFLLTASNFGSSVLCREKDKYLKSLNLETHRMAEVSFDNSNFSLRRHQRVDADKTLDRFQLQYIQHKVWKGLQAKVSSPTRMHQPAQLSSSSSLSGLSFHYSNHTLADSNGTSKAFPGTHLGQLWLQEMRSASHSHWLPPVLILTRRTGTARLLGPS